MDWFNTKDGPQLPHEYKGNSYSPSSKRQTTATYSAGANATTKASANYVDQLPLILTGKVYQQLTTVEVYNSQEQNERNVDDKVVFLYVWFLTKYFGSIQLN